ncbi:MAG: MurT ligase domain-containing protein, partial [Dolichospermum sp.]
KWPQILVGLYNKYNTLAAVTAAKEIGIDDLIIRDTINDFQAAFGRAEDLVIDSKRVRILLSKNPVGTNETIRVVTQSNDKTTLLVLNDRTPDGTDVSWIWDVDTEKLVARGGTLIVSGDRVYDMALRLRYSQESVESDIN